MADSILRFEGLNYLQDKKISANVWYRKEGNKMVREENYDVVIVGCGVGGLYTALNLPSEDRILMICKEDIESCDSMLAQGGICVLRDETDYDAYFEDTMRAGHYENRKESVDIMIRSSRDVINNLLKLGVGFDKNPEDRKSVV